MSMEGFTAVPFTCIKKRSGENKPFKHYQEANWSISSICSFAYLWHQAPQTQEHCLSPHSLALRLVLPEFQHLFGNNRKEKEGEVTGGESHAGRKGISGWRPHPTKTLTKPWETGKISSPGKSVPYRGKVPENLRQLSEGREQGLRRSSQHALRRNYNALNHERRPRQYTQPLWHACT